MIQDELLAFGLKKCSGQKIADLRVGIRFAAVLLDDGSCGVSNSFADSYMLSESKYIGEYIGLPAEKAVSQITSLNLFESAIGMATINALTQNEMNDNRVPVNAIDMIEIKNTDAVGIVGIFKPLIKQIESKADKLYIFDSKENFGSYPEWSEVMLLPECDVVFIAGCTIIKKSIDIILNSCTNAREIIVMDSTVVPAADIFRSHRVTVLGGSTVTDSGKMLEIVSQGGSGLDIQKYNEMYSIKLA